MQSNTEHFQNQNGKIRIGWKRQGDDLHLRDEIGDDAAQAAAEAARVGRWKRLTAPVSPDTRTPREIIAGRT
jgi:hypothetical protein